MRGAGVRLVRSVGRGKSAAQNAAVEAAHGEIIVFTDADTVFDQNFLSNVVAPFSDPAVGGVTGRIRWFSHATTGVTTGGGVYWRFETRLWESQSRLGLLACGSGACLAVRASVFRPIEP